MVNKYDKNGDTCQEHQETEKKIVAKKDDKSTTKQVRRQLKLPTSSTPKLTMIATATNTSVVDPAAPLEPHDATLADLEQLEA